MNICPYKGASIGGQGEIDHIYPRSLSKKHFGVIFNSEVNLIYCSSQGNREKKEEHYLLEHLSPLYLSTNLALIMLATSKILFLKTLPTLKNILVFICLRLNSKKRLGMPSF